MTPTLSLTPKPAPAPKPSGPEHLTGDAARKYVLDRVDLATLNASVPPQVEVSAQTSASVARLVAIGAAAITRDPDPDPMGYRVGLDFGTSATKVVLCSDAADVDYAMPTPPELQVDEEGRRQEHLWRTCVWFNEETQCFQLTPCATSRVILGFKTGLIQGAGHRMLSLGISHHAASTAFLALMIAYIVGFDADRREQQGALPRRYSRFHVGVPVPSLDEDPRVLAFHRVVKAAFAIVPKAGALSLDDVQTALDQEVGSTDTKADSPYQLFEELAGVVAGYMMTPEKAGGPHIIVDVGAATLDVATFYIPDGEHPLEVYESDVELFGAQALQCALAAGVPESTFRAACQAHTHAVLSRTFRTKDYAFLPGTDGADKRMVYVGGGRMTSLHQKTYEGYSKAYLAPMRSPGVGRWLDRDFTTDQERLLLAWGLAQDAGADAIPRIRPPSEVVPSLRRSLDWEAGYAGPEVC
ncbi:hypothetical protein [Brevundimonas sp. Root1423]|uniref:hypothetical protein n=1 Tax=Brevundimonas sp. Root1423 TaxID=1736462 RepID=UPI0012E39352|nr:hypothetical protein [Brevundimonas sp. Root1423]